ncbi:MAG: DNA replication/repair protein RecF [Proteobacteria bacterium]|nr:DNA replication/repair protein RecF [Pseudomonadota bacterium]
MIKQLSLRYFRNHTNFSIETRNAPFIFIHGANGVGKTNILEAISLLIPGKGLKNARTDEILANQQHLSQSWAVEAVMDTSAGQRRFLTGAEISSGKSARRTFRLDDQSIKAQQQIAEYMRVIWYTPRTDGLFLSAAGERRKFWDRMSYNLDQSHAANVAKYDYFSQSRNKLLQEPRPDTIWLGHIERDLAEAANKIIASRIASIKLIEQHLVNEATFIAPKLEIIGAAVEAYQQQQDFSSWFMETLKRNRRLDASMGRMKLSASKMDFIAYHPIKDIPASLCSTGEQKSLLISLILGQSRAIAARHSITPILLLDDILENLDATNRELLLAALRDMNIQSWITATENRGLMPQDTLLIAL